MDNELANVSEEKRATVDFFLHENALRHKDADCERALKHKEMDCERMLKVVKWMRSIVFALCAVVIIVVTTLVAYYTSRTQMWNDTIAKLTATIVEVSNAKNNAPP